MKPSRELDVTSPFGAHPLPAVAGALWQAATWPWPPGMKRRLRRIARRRHGPFDVTVEDDGRPLHFRAWPAENYCDRVLVGQGRLPEPDEHAMLRPHLAPDMTFVDVGGNVGAYSVFVGVHAPNARILALEPHPRTAAKLRFNLAANGIDATVNEAGAGEAEGQMELWSDGGGNIGQTSLLPEATSNAKVAVAVRVAPLLDLVRESGIERIDLMKLDIEGFEDRALAPFLASAPEALLPRAILLEVEHAALWKTALFARLEERGYVASGSTHQNRLYLRP